MREGGREGEREYRTCSIIRPPFLHRSSAKKKGGCLIEVCTIAPSLRPPPPSKF